MGKKRRLGTSVVPAPPRQTSVREKESQPKRPKGQSRAKQSARPVPPSESSTTAGDSQHAGSAPEPPTTEVSEVSMLEIEHDEWVPESGAEIIRQPDRSDKPERLLSWMIAPLSPAEFEAQVRERRPLHIARADRGYNLGWLGRDDIDRMLRQRLLRWTDEIDVTSYVDGKRQTLNGEGVAQAKEVWQAVDRGCSLRLSWPQRQSESLWGLLSVLEEYFGCGAGCNAYLTPSERQGFAPHYDDVDVFIMQVEGEKHWRVYSPPSDADVLPFHSSIDLDDESIGDPIASLTLRPGDLLYLPRGFVHQARTVSSNPSLHLTVSISRRHTWRDLLELALRGAIEAAAADDVAWRRSLPREYLSYMGAVHSDRADARRAAFEREAHRLLSRLIAEVPMDAACDQFACSNFMHERLPPLSAASDMSKLAPERVELSSALRLRSRNVARLCIEGDVAVLYHHTANTKVYRELDETPHVDFAMEAVPALDRILTAYPKYVTVGKLPLETDAQKLDVANALVEAELVLVKEPNAATAIPDGGSQG